MKPTIRVSAILFLSIAGALCGGSEPAEDGSSEWVVYEDARLRFEYPKGWRAMSEEASPPQTHNKIWRLSSPDGGVRGLGDIDIYGYPIGHEKRPLAKMFRQDDWIGMRAVEKPRLLKLKGAECIRYRMEGRGADITGGPRIETITAVNCYDRAKIFFEIMSTHSRYDEVSKPDERYQKNRKIFDRVLNSLEFKEPPAK